MVRIIDMECTVPKPGGESEGGSTGAYGGGGNAPAGALEQPKGYGMANYARIFKGRAEARTQAQVALDEYVEMLGRVGVERAVPFGTTNAEAAELLRAYPDRFIGLARMSAHDGMRAVRELERLVREEGFRALGVSALADKLPASDRRFYPLYTKAAELEIPVRIYCAMNYANDRPYDLGHPRNIDQVAMDFPELTIIAGLGGWPWVNDMIGLLRRHPKLHCDTSAHRPKYIGQPGSGWEMLLQFGNTLVQDKVLVGLSPGLIGLPYETLIQEYLSLPLKEAVKEKWLYGNAARVFGFA
jgi:predicted TIM-barrel fold metal-dependent hydrolase